MDMTLFIVDAFTTHSFSGNPAGVVPLVDPHLGRFFPDAWPSDELLQSIAMENNQAETAFFALASPEQRDAGVDFELRWFTPTMEMDLCGHATLAAAHVLTQHLAFTGQRIRFATRSGVLEAAVNAERITLNFPSRPGAPVQERAEWAAVANALGIELSALKELRRARDYLAVLADETSVSNLQPDMLRVAKLDAFAVIATARCASTSTASSSANAAMPSTDFVSRFFAPKAGVPEDPVTGSAHCTLIPYWAGRLNRSVLTARQISRRGGTLYCEFQSGRGDEDRVLIGGAAKTYCKGSIFL